MKYKVSRSSVLGPVLYLLNINVFLWKRADIRKNEMALKQPFHN
jgi:hypothetical protein